MKNEPDVIFTRIRSIKNTRANSRIRRRIRDRSKLETNDLTGSTRYVSRATEVDSIE